MNTKEETKLQNWLIPPEIYEDLDKQFHFDFDPCPYPRPNDFNGVDVEWGKSNFVNPPFRKADAAFGAGPTAFARKAIEENKKGKTVVLTLPVQSYVCLLVEAGAEVRSLGRVKWLETRTREEMKRPSSICCFVLRGKK